MNDPVWKRAGLWHCQHRGVPPVDNVSTLTLLKSIAHMINDQSLLRERPLRADDIVFGPRSIPGLNSVARLCENSGIEGKPYTVENAVFSVWFMNVRDAVVVQRSGPCPGYVYMSESTANRALRARLV